MEVQEEPNDPVQGPANLANKPVFGTVRKTPSSTEVYINAKQGYLKICNYTYEIAGNFRHRRIKI